MGTRAFHLANESADTIDAGLLAYESSVVVPIIDASESGDRLCRLIYEFDTAGVLSDRNRMYPASEVAREVERISKIAKAGKLFGKVDHPRSKKVEDLLENNMTGAATRVVEVSMVNPRRVKVVHDVMHTDAGRHLHGIIRSGGRPGTSQRAVVRTWRKASKQELANESITADPESVSVADGLRLVTYDIVTNSGLAEAGYFKAVENATMLTLDQVKSTAPEVYAAIVQIGRTEATAGIADQLKAAVESAKPGIIAEAIAPLTKQLEVANAKVKVTEAVTAALESAGVIKPGVATPAPAATGSDPATLKLLEETGATLKSTLSALESANTRLAVIESDSLLARINDQVRSKFGRHRHFKLINDHAVKGKTLEEGLKLANEKAAEIELIAGGASQNFANPAASSFGTGANENAGNGAGEGVEQSTYDRAKKALTFGE